MPCVSVVSPSPTPRTQTCLQQWRRYSSGPDQSGFVMNTFLGNCKMELGELFPFLEGVVQKVTVVTGAEKWGGGGRGGFSSPTLEREGAELPHISKYPYRFNTIVIHDTLRLVGSKMTTRMPQKRSQRV
jgi:hypothetical protein